MHGLHTERGLLGRVDHGHQQSFYTQIQVLLDEGRVTHRHTRNGVIDGVCGNGLELLLNALQIVGRMFAIDEQPIKARHGTHFGAVTVSEA